ncbi:MAG: anhydro-N-acetylmuramic acid kinase [Anaerolineales bacterium]|nr:anhydro-N-acetylmuramic acid kinase [Anaerolineales bacterium]
MIVVGMISGTSADGIEAVVTRLEGAPPTVRWELLAHRHVPYAPELRAEVFACFRPETGTVDRLCALNFALGRAFGAAALEAIAAAGLTPLQVDLIGSHGQTLWHIADGPQASTLQLGEPAVIAEVAGLPVVSNFRTRDMAVGGQGAPLASYPDTILFRHERLTRAVQNIGGIGNVTYLPPDGVGALGFDTGPGNMLMDDAVQRLTGGAETYDRDGLRAARGTVHAGLLAELLTEPYLRLAPPKTTGRELFGAPYGAQVWARADALGLSGDDRLATLTAFTARSIAQAYRDFLPTMPDEVYVCGGGAHNPTLMHRLRAELAPARVEPIDALGLPSEAKEAQFFAVLAYETWHGRPGNLPEATGAGRHVILGNLTPGPYTPVSPQAPSALTEARNPQTEHIDELSTAELVRVINAEDSRVAPAVAVELPRIAEAIDRVAERMRAGGRLIYFGAGTSGRLGVLDAAECPPTFGTAPDEVVARLAGGAPAITQSVEGAEDDPAAGAQAIAELQVTATDSVMGIAASGGTPYVLGALQEARRRGALTLSLACNRPSAVEALADVAIAPLVGPEVVTGSTRLKAGTAQKLVLNMLSTGVMIRLGKTLGNLMVDVRPINAKLRERARRIVSEACDLSPGDSTALLERCGDEVKTAIVVGRTGLDPAAARAQLAAAGGRIQAAIRASTGE